MMTSNRLTGAGIDGGRYTILGRVAHGNMGDVYRARDAHLAIDVVLKFPVAAGASAEDPGFLERFDREVRSLIRLSHPHVVKVIDVGRHEGRPYVVMQYLEGGSLKDRIEEGPERRGVPMSPESLGEWLMDVSRALDFIHAQGFVHRDVKPANILFDAHGNAFMGDFGIMKALGRPDDIVSSSLTAPGFLLGTPSYVAPEVVMGGTPDARVDQYALAMTVHEVLIGSNTMAGPSPSATVVNQMNREPPRLCKLLTDVPERVSEAVHKALSKDPEFRFASCTVFAREVLSALAPEEGQGSGWIAAESKAPGSTPELQDWADAGTDASFVVGSGTGALPDASAATMAVTSYGSTPIATSAPANPALGSISRVRRRGLVGAAAVALFGVALFAAWFLRREGPRPLPGADGRTLVTNLGPAAAGSVDEPVTINIVYGTEKQAWLEHALEEYLRRPEARGVKINLMGKGSVEGAQMILAGASPVPVHVWSPASAVYRDVFEKQWRARHGNRPPISRAENLALTPMIFVMWKARYEAFVKKYGTVNFHTIAEAAREPGGWGAIAGHPEWGRFKIGHTHPKLSNSGLVALVLMAYEHSHKQRGLITSDVHTPSFRAWLSGFEGGVTRHGGGLTNSTGTLMREMVLRGPSQYDCLVVYESLAVEYMDRARDLWGDLHVAYPEPNFWNEHPYYVIDAPWSGEAQREVANRFLDFLMSTPVQKRALEHGFRPGNP